MVKDMSISFPLINQKEKERNHLLTKLQSIERSLKIATQPSPMFVYTTHQPRQSLYKDLSVLIASPFLLNSLGQNLWPLTIIHPTYNPLKTSEILLNITYPQQLKPESQNHPQNKPFLTEKTKIHWIKLQTQLLVHPQNLQIWTYWP